MQRCTEHEINEHDKIQRYIVKSLNNCDEDNKLFDMENGQYNSNNDSNNNSNDDKYSSFTHDQTVINKAIVASVTNIKNHVTNELNNLSQSCKNIKMDAMLTDSKVYTLNNDVKCIFDDVKIMDNLQHKKNDELDNMVQKLSTKITDLENQLQLKNTKIAEIENNLSFTLQQHSTELVIQGKKRLELENQFLTLSNKINALQMATNSNKDINAKNSDNIKNILTKIDDMKQTQQTQRSNVGTDTADLFTSGSFTSNVTKLSKLQIKKDIKGTRKERARVQNIYLKDYTVNKQEKSIVCEIIGTTNNIYSVRPIGHPQCTCLDYVNNKNRCKHIYYVLENLLSVKNSDKATYSYEEIVNM